MSKTIEEAPAESVQDLVGWLVDEAGMDFDAIAEAMEWRVSGRTIRRWSKGESQPSNKTDHTELAALVARARSAA